MVNWLESSNYPVSGEILPGDGLIPISYRLPRIHYVNYANGIDFIISLVITQIKA